jgi:hypothetical protein
MLLIIGFFTVGFVSGCREGCRDENSDNYNSEKKIGGARNCEYRFLTSVEVSYFPYQYAGGSPWDSTIQHTLMISFTNGSTDFVFNPITSTGHAVTFVPNSSNKLWNRNYCYQLYDQNALFNDCTCPSNCINVGFGWGVIASGNINPLKIGSDGKITVTATNGTVITFHYELREG